MIGIGEIVWALMALALVALIVVAVGFVGKRRGGPGQGQAIAGLVLVAILAVAFAFWSWRLYQVRPVAPVTTAPAGALENAPATR
ncbi:hypothetical protein [Salinarimonas ramus]|uniref:Uncharacterized protein n=1 Tax=Salinarimonas ramus TaxID=690164 RepID=A0A917QIB3_9HYPH|nr:hypothetical protein [Salinarimonas ramus]GGK51158.1 hypothetical protein GCM10011322_42800 [Salinarimonas ramus]